MAKILMVIPYEFYPPMYGGALRCFYLLREMARYHELTLLTVQPLSDFSKAGVPAFPKNVIVKSTADQTEYQTALNILPARLANALNSKLLRRSFLRKGNLYLLKTYPVLKRILKENKFDFVCYENLECFTILHKQVKRLSPGTKHIYDAHNVDSELWQQQADALDMPELLKYAAGALNQEKKLYRNVEICFCCSDLDKKKLMAINKGRLIAEVIPNGVDCASRPFDTNTDKNKIKNILFCGTLDYVPNIEGVLWFYEKIFPLIKNKIPDIKFTVIGKMHKDGPYASLIKDNSVNFIGPVDDVVEYYRQSSLLIVPLLKGSGTRLKILEAMSMGNPVISTGIGAEGLKLINRNQVLIADNPTAFSQAIIELLNTPSLFNKIRKNARDLVSQEFDWKFIGSKVHKKINTIMKDANKINSGL